MIDSPIVLTPFRDALASLQEALREPTESCTHVQQQMFRDSILQRFEYTYELAWRSIKRCLEQELHESLDAVGRRDLFRRAFEFGLVSDPEVWFSYQESRNKTSHAYDQHIALEAIAAVPAFARDAEQLFARLEQRYG